MFLVDADMISQRTKPLPRQQAMNWHARTPIQHQFVSVVTLQELQFGIERLPLGAKRSKLEFWFEQDILLRYAGRILPLTQDIALLAGKTLAAAIGRGYNLGIADIQIAATALYHNLTLATLNTKHFALLGIPMAEL